MSFPFVKGHGTRNDFVVLPDLDGTVHGDLAPDVVAALCDRHGGIGADGVLRVLRGDVDGGDGWFMDYRNADGSVAQVCGNGIRVFARYLAESGLVDVDSLDRPLAVDTRDGVKLVSFCDDGEISVDMGSPKVGGSVTVSVEGRVHTGRRVDLGNPHAVVFVDGLQHVGALVSSPYFCGVDYPDGVNIEFVERRGQRDVAMRVFERGVGETLSCGTGACAAVAAALVEDSDAASAVGPGRADVATGQDVKGAPGGVPATYAVRTPGDPDVPAMSAEKTPGALDMPATYAVRTPGDPDVPATYAEKTPGALDMPATYVVEVPGGLLSVTWGEDDHIHLKGPAVLVATGTWSP